MDVLRSVFLIRHLYSRQTWAAALFDSFYLLLALVVLWQAVVFVMVHVGDFVLPLIGLAVLWWTLRKWLIIYLIHNRLHSRAYIPALQLHTATKFSASALNAIHDKYDSFQTIAEDVSWQLFDAMFDSYRKAKGGDYKSKETYFTVYEHQLTRELPHIIFDSKRARGRQFRFRYIASQRVSLEGNFDTYFDTYTPDFYEVDSLAFISPEVMHVLIEASEYDIEITQDRLFVYGPLASTKGANRQFALGQKLATAINDNIRHYTDSYLPQSQSKTQTTAFGRQLLQSPLRHIVGASVALAVCLALVAAAVTYKSPESLLNTYAFLAYFYLGTSTYQAIKIHHQNNAKLKTFLAIKHYTAHHPNR